MDFHKVSESEDAVLFQAMKKLDTKPDPGGNEVRKYGPELPKKITDATLTKAFEDFEGYDIDAISVSRDGGVTVRVKRDKEMPDKLEEPDVERLESRKGGKK